MAKSNLVYFVGFIVSVALCIATLIFDIGSMLLISDMIIAGYFGWNAFNFHKGKVTDVILEAIEEGRVVNIMSSNVEFYTKNKKRHSFPKEEVFIRQIQRKKKKKKLEELYEG